MHRQPLLKKWVIPALTGAVVSGSALACGGSAGRAAVESTDVAARAAVQPGITVLLGDSLGQIGIFLIFILVLLVRPAGLFGARA